MYQYFVTKHRLRNVTYTYIQYWHVYTLIPTAPTWGAYQLYIITGQKRVKSNLSQQKLDRLKQMPGGN
jgi:hypothetical protein